MNAYMGGYQGAGMGRGEGLSGDPGRSGENALGRNTGRGVRRSDEAHPWRSISRWSAAWRVALSVLAIGLSVALLTVLLFADGRIDYFAPDWFAGAAMVVVPAMVTAVLAAALHGWLRRFLPITQAVLFGLVAYATALFVTWLLPIVTNGSGIGCALGPPCVESTWALIVFTAVVLFPVMLISGLSYLLARGSVTWAGKRVFLGVLAGALVVTVIFIVSVSLGGGDGTGGSGAG